MLTTRRVMFLSFVNDKRHDGAQCLYSEQFMAKNEQEKGAKKPLTVDEFLESYTPIFNESVLAADPLPYVILAVAYIEQALRTLLAKFFIDSSTSDGLLDFKGAIGSFKAKTDLAYSLGLIPKLLFQNLCVIGEVRNKFAHSHVDVSFDSEEMIQLLDGKGKPGLVIPQQYNFWDTDKTYRHWFNHKKSVFTSKGRKKFEAGVSFSLNVLWSLLRCKVCIVRRPRLIEDREGKNQLFSLKNPEKAE